MADYDIGEAFRRIEEEMIASMMRNLDHHRAEEEEKGYNWSMWQTEQLKALEQYRQNNLSKYSDEFKSINSKISGLITMARAEGNMDQEAAILSAIKKGFKANRKSKDAMTGAFFRLNDKKLEALIKATTDDFENAELAMLRRADDQYRKIIFNAQVYANTGAATYEKAVDMATKDFLAAGINCVEYKNGSRHTISDYADMCIKTATKRAYLTGEGEKRKEWGISTVIMNKRGNPCPKCLPFVGKILIDDVWSGGKPEDGPYMLMSKAVEAGLYHPRCKDSHTTYFDFLNEEDNKVTDKEKSDIIGQYNAEQKENYFYKQEQKCERLAKYSLDPDNKRMYQDRANSWESKFKHVHYKTGEKTPVEYVLDKENMVNNYREVTEEWIKKASNRTPTIKDLYEYSKDGITYVVDGRHVILDYSEKEKKIAELIVEKFGGEIKMIPKVLFPQGISTPDYIYENEKFDLKELKGSSRHLVYNRLSKNKKQANNFIIDISNCSLDIDEIKKQIEYVYWSKHTQFVNKVIVVKDNSILGVYEKIEN